jgi:hypothetical protein
MYTRLEEDRRQARSHPAEQPLFDPGALRRALIGQLVQHAMSLHGTVHEAPPRDPPSRGISC